MTVSANDVAIENAVFPFEVHTIRRFLFGFVQTVWEQKAIGKTNGKAFSKKIAFFALFGAEDVAGVLAHCR